MERVLYEWVNSDSDFILMFVFVINRNHVFAPNGSGVLQQNIDFSKELTPAQHIHEIHELHEMHPLAGGNK